MAIKLDLLGSWQHLGVDDFRADRAVRRFRVTGLNLDNQSIGAAIKEALTAAGLDHHSEIYRVGIGTPTIPPIGLPLHYIEAHREGLVVYGKLVYKRGRPRGGLNDPLTGQGGFQVFKKFERFYRESEDPVSGAPLFDSFGLPAGDMYEMSPAMLIDEKKPPRGYMHEISLVRLILTTSLSFNPYFADANLIKKTNDSQVTFGAAGDFDANTIMFDGPDIQAFSDSQGLFYDVTYTFLIRPQGWFRQVARFENGEWTTQPQLIYDQDSFLSPHFQL